MARTADTATGEVHEEEVGPGELPFAAWFQDLNRGAAHAEMTDELRALVETVMLCRKKGTLDLKLTVAPTGSEQVVVTWEVVPKPPKAELPAAIFYVDRVHNLRREDPNALPFGDLREIPAETTPTTVREVQL